MEVFTDFGIEAAAYTSSRGVDDGLPWDHIDCGVTKGFLLRERAKALAAETTADCRGGCNGCGWQARTKAKGCPHG